MSVTFFDNGVMGDSYLIGTSPQRAAKSAKQILQTNPNAPSGFYYIQWPGVTNNEPLLIYCDMTGSSAGSSVGGWMRFDTSTFNKYARILATNINVNRSSGYAQGVISDDMEPTIRLKNMYWAEASSNGTMYFACSGVSGEVGTMRSIKIRVPQGTRGIRVTSFDFQSINGPDGAGYNDYLDDPSVAPTKQQIVSCGDGNTVTLGANYTSFGIYFGDHSGNGRRVYIGNSASPWTGEVLGTFVPLTTSRFVQYDDIGSDADRIIWYESDGDTEYDHIYGFTFWLR